MKRVSESRFDESDLDGEFSILLQQHEIEDLQNDERVSIFIEKADGTVREMWINTPETVERE